ncbi:XRE family transcriptional regulator [Streptomyces alfalfae]|uniref:Helix-turn-helix domain-containing protein n=1 Tax=Streptomyces alfalfae TaxID=1642299 RepID=A0A4Q7EPS2_9ACTN|nr:MULTISPECIES: helix-turn-helix domain-containing protein [Streptomyces]AYA20185.1 XRE family transcriptional regulator [Streptomyces fradiae]QQC87784.1 helix-turn-helix domain-containing protein [Streptomyces alfalfae]QUI30214.1 helix-turn-helix domain-containing protein [Streptomyces alfalfae]RXX43676.1 XRE family transcriptional regulator [Streptomyces alfalfae]RZM87485.1 XRE family transcriptional regulator [Streptomyces alfalfae]
MNKTALRALLRERRALIAPESHGFSRPSGQGRRAPGLSQHQVDQLLHRTFGTYHRLESGNYPNAPTTLLRDVARLFGLNEQEWVSLNRYALLQDPPGPLHLSSGKEVPGVWQEAVDGISHMAYVTDASWDMLAYNEPLAEMFPDGNVPANVMRWMVLDPDGRRALMDWHASWAPMVLPQLRAALASRPEDDTLCQIEKEVLADPETSALYRTGVSHPHPDGDERPLLHPAQGPGWVTMCTAQPMTAPGARLMILVFHPGEFRSHQRVPMLRAV